MGLQWTGGLDTNSTIDDALERAQSGGTLFATKKDGRGVAYKGIHNGIPGEFWVQSTYPQSRRISSMMFKSYFESKDMAVVHFNLELGLYSQLYGMPSEYDFDPETVDFVSEDKILYYEVAAWTIDNERCEIGVAYDTACSLYRYSVFLSNR